MKTKSILKRIAAGLTALALCLTAADTTSFAKATSKPMLSDTSHTMMTNEEYMISLERAASKVTWKSSNPGIVKIEKSFGKYGRDVSLATGNKTGVCTIKAKMKNKTYSCKITVKKGIIIKKYSGKKSKTQLENITQTKKSIVIRYKMCNAAKKNCKCPPASYGLAIRLEKYINGKWCEIQPKYDLAVCAVMFVIPSKTSVSKAIHLEDYFDISQLTKGKYRLYVNVFYPDVKDPYVEFNLN